MYGPEMTKNSFTVEKSGVREREIRPTYIEVAIMNKSGVGEYETRPTNIKVADSTLTFVQRVIGGQFHLNP